MATQYRVVGRFRCSEKYHTIGELNYRTKVDAMRALEKFQAEYGVNRTNTIVSTPIGAVEIEDDGSDYDVLDMHVVKREVSPWERI